MGIERLESIAEENRRQLEFERRQKPERCPIDGLLLEERNGIRNCPMGNYRWPEGT